MNFQHILNLDIETFATTNIKLGEFPYAQTAIPIIMAFSLDGAPEVGIDLTKQPLPRDILFHLQSPLTLKRAYNAKFERTVLSTYYEIDLPPEQWECTMIRALMCGLPASLDASSKALGLSDNKDAEGKKLIQYFCVPCKPSKTNNFRDRNLPIHDPERWERFIQYCKQDVVVERAVFDACAWYEISAFEKIQWNLDQRINARGIMVNKTLVTKAITMEAQARTKLMDRAIELTGLRNPNSVKQLKTWLEDIEFIKIPSLAKQPVTELLKTVTEDVSKELLNIRLELSKSSVKKYKKMLQIALDDNRIYGSIQYYGANRTGRYAGRGVQPQNFTRIDLDGKIKGGKIDVLDLLRDMVLNDDVESIQLYFGSVLVSLSQLIRTALIPKPGHKFIVSDFTAIEAVVIAWLAGEQWRLDLFSAPGKPKLYEASASQMFGIPIEQIDKGSPYRQAGKVAELACGYQGGPDALWRMIEQERAKGSKIELTEEECLPIIKQWRQANKQICRLWYDLQTAAIECIKTKQIVPVTRGLAFEWQNNCLLMRLPSGRKLVYQGCGLDTVKFWKTTSVETVINGEYEKIAINEKKLINAEFILNKQAKQIIKANYIYKGEMIIVYVKREIALKEVISYMEAGNTFKRTHTYGGKLAENAVQAIARDLLANALLNLEEADYNTILHVHDETVNEVPLDFGSVEEVNALMIDIPSWAQGMPVKADGFETLYYKKD